MMNISLKLHCPSVGLITEILRYAEQTWTGVHGRTYDRTAGRTTRILNATYCRRPSHKTCYG